MNIQKWSNDMRLIVECDNRTVEQIMDLIKWSGQHVFWHTVVLSPAAIRRNWDQMHSQMKQDNAKSKGEVLRAPNRRHEEFVLDYTIGEVE